MSIFDFFFGRKQNENNSRRGVKLNRHAVRTRNLAMEPLETRDLLSVTTGLIDDSAYAELRTQYPEFNLPEEQSTLNVITVDLDEGATALKLSDLKSAISQATSSTKSDLILVKTTDSANTIKYSSSSDQISISVDSTQYGSVTIIGWGTNELTLNANQKCRVMSISGKTDAYLGNLTINNGKTTISTTTNNSVKGYGGGISSTSTGILSLKDCNILNNKVSVSITDSVTNSDASGGGIYSESNSVLTLINCIITNNSTESSNKTTNSTSDARACAYSYGGGIYYSKHSGILNLNNCTISNNSVSSRADGSSTKPYYNSVSLGGGLLYGFSEVNLKDCNFFSNPLSSSAYSGTHSTAWGSAFYNDGMTSDLSVINCTINSDMGLSSFDINGVALIKNSAFNNVNISISGGNEWSILNSSIIGPGDKDCILIYSSSSSPTLTISNSLIQGWNYGVFSSVAADAQIINSTISDNSYGLYLDNASEIFNIYNSIIVNNTNADVYLNKAATVNAYNTLSSDFEWSDGSENLIYDSALPLFVDAENSDFQLAENSQAINTGNNQYYDDSFGSVDLAGSPRIQGRNIDMGAYEYEILTEELPSPSFSLSLDNSNVVVTISEVENVTGYQIEYALNEEFTDSSVVDAQAGENVLENLTQGQTYYVRVMSLGDDVYTDSDYSETQSIFLKLVLPAPPTIAVEVNSIDSVTATVSETDNAVGYRVQYATNEDFTRSTIVDVDAGETILRGLNPGTTYYFRAYAYSDDGLSSDFSNVETVTLPDVPVLTELDTPDVLSLTLDGTTITASWSVVDNASTYTVEYQATGSDAWTTIPNISGTQTSFAGLTGTTYNVKVKANGTGNYSDSAFSESETVYIPIPLGGLTLSTFAPAVGTTITTSLAPSDATVDYQWYCGTTIIDGADESSFTVTEEQIGQTITCIATANGAYTRTVSATTAVVPALPLDTPNVPSLTLDGTTITATWSAVENASTYTVEYQATGSDAWTTISNISGTTTFFVGLTGTTYNVRVKSNGTGNYSDSAFSESTSVYIPISLSGLTLSTDTPEVGTTISTTLAPSGATADYQWYCGMTIINGAINASFTVTEDQIGQTITCIATGTGNYVGTASATTAVVPALPLDTPNAPSLTLDGTTITATWSAVENASTYTVEYLAIGSDAWTTIPNIAGTTTSFVGLTGTTYNVKVKANGTWNYSDSAFSESTPVYIPILLTNLTLSTDAPEVGTTITTTLSPSDAIVDYQWYCGTTIIDGAEESSFTVTEAQIGQTITCIATGTGNYSGTASATTAVVPALPLDTPNAPSLTLDGTAVTATWSAVDNASTYTVEYQATGSDAWTTIPNILETTTSFVGLIGTTYNVKVKANGTGDYCDSEFSESTPVYIPIPLSGLTLSNDAPEVGTTITTILAPSDTAVDYQWYSGETAITGATESSFKVTEAQIGQTITCIATGTGNYTGTVSATTAVVPALSLDTPDVPTLTLDGTTITATWSAVDNSSTYTVEYHATGSDAWTTIPNISGTTTSFVGLTGTTYNVKVKANGIGNYSDSEFSGSTPVYIPIPLNDLTLSTYAPEVGTAITASFDQTGITAEYQWYCGETPITSATESSFLVTEEQIGQTITCVATGTGNYTGTVSSATAVVPALPLDTPTAPSLTAEDTLVTATWSKITNASSYTVEYQVDGSDGWFVITGVNGTTTTFVGVAGAKYNVKVQANGTGNYSNSEFSESASITLAVPPTQLTGLTLSNYAPEVGTTIIATLDQTDATVDYQWYCGTTIIDKASASSFTVTESQIGQKITCVATGTGNYIGTVSATTAVVPALPLDTPTAPSLTAEDTLITATWSKVTNASSYTVEYQVDGSDGWFVIAGINGTTTSFIGIAGTTYNVRVKANGTGNYSDSGYSESSSITLAVPPTQITNLTLSTDSPTVGTVISTTLSPSDATVEYQWYCGDTAITGATESSFIVTEEQIGQTITCVAIGTGNYTGSVSGTTAVVPTLPLDTPNAPTLTLDGTTIIATWSAVNNASTYTVEYQATGSDAWTTIPNISGTSTSFIGLTGTTYNVKVKANGTGNYSDSEFSESTPVYITIPLTGLTLSIYAPEVGTTITTTLDPSDATVEYQWYSGETEIDGATTSSLTITEEQIGQTITCFATGTGDYTGTVSATTAVVPALPLIAPSVPTLTANNTIVTAEWDAVENASGYTLECIIDGESNKMLLTDIQGTSASIIGAYGKSYTIRIKAVGTGNYSDSDYSETASFTLRTPLTSLALSSIAPEVGTEIIASLIPTDATADYQWYSGETLIEGATGSSFVVTEDQIGQTITCVATGTGDYTGTVSMTTAVVPVPVVPLDAPADLALSAENTAITATWSAVENASSYTLLYQIDGADGWTTVSDIQSSTASFIGIAGMTYNVKVQANGTGDYSDSEFSDALSIKLYIPITGITLSNNSPIVGSTITATLNPSDATVDYQWYSGETLIEGAEGASYVVTEDQIGQTITCIATGTGDYTGTVSATTAAVPVPVVPLDAPADIALSVYNATVTASWSAVENASSYTLEYKPVGAENWTALPGLEDTTASFVGISGTMYNVRVKAVGTGDYSDSTYTEINTDKPTGPVVAINANKVTVSWVDDSPAADAVRYRVAGTTRWTLKKLKAGITELSFNATIGTNYDIEVLLDQQENNVLQGSAIVLDQPRLTSIRNELKDDTFQVNVTNYAAKNLAANVKQAIVSVNGVMTTLKIADQPGETALANGGKVAFSNGLFTFSEMNSNTSYKVMISFSDGHSVSKTSSALTVKTLKAPYLPPVIVSANAVSDTSITVTWDTAYGKNSTTPAQKYTVQYSTDGAKWTNATTGATGNSFTIQRLKGGVEYQVRVLATKDAAFEASAPSGVLSAQTLTLPKTVLDRTSVKDDTFKLDVTNYATSNLVNAPTLNVKSDKFGEAAIAIQNGSGSATFENGMVAAFENGALTFTNVPSNTQQRIQVNFSDGVCTTAWTAALTVKTTIAPYNKPVITNATAVSSTSVLVEWDAVTGKNSTVLAPSYTVQYTTDGTRWTNANTRVVGTSFTIPNLKPNTPYRVAVIANKDAQFNASQPSESWEVRTL